jgi:hypothetical protein
MQGPGMPQRQIQKRQDAEKGETERHTSERDGKTGLHLTRLGRDTGDIRDQKGWRGQAERQRE